MSRLRRCQPIDQVPEVFAIVRDPHMVSLDEHGAIHRGETSAIPSMEMVNLCSRTNEEMTSM